MGKMIIRTQESKADKKDLEFNIVDELFTIATRENGDVIRLDYAAWGNGEPKYELRLWHKGKDNKLTRKGIGLSGEELIALRDALNEMEAE